MTTQKNTKVTTYKYDDCDNVIETKVVEEVEIPEPTPILYGIDLDDGITFDTELTAEKETSPVDIIFGLAGVMSIIATGIAIVKSLKGER